MAMTMEGWPVKPMELVIHNEPYDSADTIFQVKWDGVRCLAYAFPGRIQLFNRRLNARTSQYPELVQCLSFLPKGTVLDGEIIALDADGKPSFPRVLRRDLSRSPIKIKMQQSAVPVSYMVFDILWLDEKPLYTLPLMERLDILNTLPLKAPVRTVDSVTGHGTALFEAVKAEALEGIVAKKAGSPYLFGERSPLWQKIKCLREVDGVIGGYIPKEDGVRSLLVGIPEEHSIWYIGKASSGVTQKGWRQLQAQLLRIPGPCPFANPPMERKAEWVLPVLPIRVRFLEYTQDGVMRAPAVIGLQGGLL